MTFKKAAHEIAEKEHIPLKHANAILAAASRRASPMAKKRNPKLKRVKG